MQSKGIVMQIANDQVVVMTADCQFRKIPFLEGMIVGQEVELPAESLTAMPKQKKTKAWYAKPWTKTGLVAASVMLAVGLWGSQSFLGSPSAYAYVTVDINPSVELSIGKEQQVLVATPLNEEAQRVLDDLKLKGLPVNQAVESLAQAAQQKGFFQENTEVIITASAAVDEAMLKAENVDLVKLEDDLVTKVKTLAAEQNQNIAVEAVLISPDVRDAAKQAGVSPGKYAVYLNATSNGIDVNLEELKNKPIHKVVAEQPQIAEVVDELEGGEKLDDLLKTLKEQGKSSLLEYKTKNQGVLPANANPEKEDDKKTNPGQAKKQEDESKKNQPTNQSTSNSKSSDRESSQKTNKQSTNGSTNKSDEEDQQKSKQPVEKKDERKTDDKDKKNDKAQKDK